MKKFKHIISVLMVVLLLISCISVSSAVAETGSESTREVIAAFNFENTGKTAGQDLDEYLAPGESNTYLSTKGSATLKYDTFKWSDDVFFDSEGNEVGIAPMSNSGYLQLQASMRGYQNIEVSFDMGYCNEENDINEGYLLVYTDNARHMELYYPFKMNSSNTMENYKVSVKGPYIEDPDDIYNELYFRFTYGQCVINNIEITGTRVNPEVGRQYIYGDADEDGEITINDSTRIQQEAAGLGEKYFVAPPKDYNDVNGDGTISVLDSTCIQKYVAGYTEGCEKTGTIIKYNKEDL